MPLHLYHCTTSAGLRGILTSKAFHPSYCLEKADYQNEKADHLSEYETFVFAMVCLADQLDIEARA